MFKKLKRKFLILNLFLISVVMITSFAAIYLVTWQNIITENNRKLDMTSADRLPIPTPAEDDGFEYHVVNVISPEYTLTFSVDLDNNQNITTVFTKADMPRETYQKLVEHALSQGSERGSITLGNQKWQYKFHQAQHLCFLDITEAVQPLSSLLTTLSLIGIVMLAIIFLISLFFSNKAITPITEAWEKQEQFIADASHELKTPLMIVNANYGMLMAKKTETIESQIQWFENIQFGIEKMSKLIEQMLSIAKMDKHSKISELKTINVSKHVSESINAMKAAAADKNIKVICQIEPNIKAKSDEEAISNITAILVDNAIKYANCDGLVEIALERAKGQIRLSVMNDGTGIAKEDISKVFERFYKADKSRSEDNNSFGLGLAIAKSIVERLQGTIKVESKIGEYTTFSILLPLLE